MRPTSTPVTALFKQARSIRPAATSPSKVNFLPRRNFTSSIVRRDDQSRAKGESFKTVINRPEITPLFLFTGSIIGLAVFFLGRHLIKDKELRLDHKQQNRLATKTDQLDFEAMKHVAKDPEGKLTKEAIEEDKRRTQRKEDIRKEREEKAQKKL